MTTRPWPPISFTSTTGPRRPPMPVLLCTKCYDNAAVLAKLPAGQTTPPDPERVRPATPRLRPRVGGHRVVRLGVRSGPAAHADHQAGRSARGAKRPLPRSPSPAGGVGRENRPLPPWVRDWGRGISSASSKSPDINPIKHTKLMYNAAISPLAAAAGIDNGNSCRFPRRGRSSSRLLQENHRILTAAGIELGKVGPFHPTTVAWILRRRWLAGVYGEVLRAVARGTYCSMAGEIQKGRTEIDNYNGHLIRLAEETGTPCPLNRAVYDLVVTMTAERAMPQPARC